MRSTVCVVAIGVASFASVARAQDPAAPAFRPFPDRSRTRSSRGWSIGSNSKSTRPLSKDSRNSAIGARERIETAPPSTGLRRSSKATGVPTPNASPTPIRLRKRRIRTHRLGALPRARAAAAGQIPDHRGRSPAPTRGGAREGGSSQFGPRARTGVYQPDAPGAAPLDPRLRELNAQPTTPGQRQNVYCTKIGTTHPDEMYIVGGHMDGHGWGEAANDDGSGTALVMELARVLSSPDVQTERSIRFVLWNNEETGLNGAWAYVNQRKNLQGKEDPPGSGRYPEPKWLGMIQHDMMMWDHGMPGADGKVPAEQRREADVDIEFQMNSKLAEGAQKLAWALKAANDKYATDYPASVGPHMTNTDSTPFLNLVPAISLRENERGMQIGAGWDPNWHQPSDVFATYTDKDFRLGLNAAQTTLGAIAQLAGATVKK